MLHDHLHEVKEEFFQKETREAVAKRFWVYLDHWLSSLWVVAHAFRHVLKLEDKIINELIDRNFKILSDFRNATYHYHRTPEKQVQFFVGRGALNSLNWAEDSTRSSKSTSKITSRAWPRFIPRATTGNNAPSS